MAKAFQTVGAGSPNPPAKTSVGSNQPVFAGETITVATGDLTLANKLGHILLPKGAEVLAVQLDATDLDSGTAITLSIGDVDDPDRLLLANTIGQAGAVPVGPTIAKTGFGYQYEEETLVQVAVAVAPTTAVAGTIKYGVWYISQ